MLDKITEISLLYDFYGGLLPERQREAFYLYHEENLSLAEIAAEFSISRQGVHDALKNAERALHEYEEKLGLVKRFSEEREALTRIDAELESLISENNGDGSLIGRLKGIKDIIDGMY